MPTPRCVVCDATSARAIWRVERVAIHPLRPPGVRRDRGFGRLAIVACETCGHLYNAAFDPGGLDDLYAALVLTNQPVSASMIAAVDETAALILRHAPSRPSVLEVGGGGGALSLALAQRGAAVDLVEPSRAVTAERFAGSGVTLHNSMFPVASLAGRRFDVVACRQVIEHVPEPAPFLIALRNAVADGGIAYIELPSAGYIRHNGSVVDFHYPHVHYYRGAEIELLFARAGFAVEQVIDVKSGHDTAYLLRARASAGGDLPTPAADDLAAALEVRRAQGRRRLAAIDGPIALYGANAYSQALLGLYPDIATFAAMFDDTPSYAGQCAYGPSIELAIERPQPDRLDGIAAVVITAYLHDRDIAAKLQALGYRGPVYSVRTDREAGIGARPPSLFGDELAG
jgi:SAM-dependent methyltransferase